MAFLQGLGLPPALAHRVGQRHGGNTEAAMRCACALMRCAPAGCSRELTCLCGTWRMRACPLWPKHRSTACCGHTSSTPPRDLTQPCAGPTPTSRCRGCQATAGAWRRPRQTSWATTPPRRRAAARRCCTCSRRRARRRATQTCAGARWQRVRRAGLR